VGDAGTLGVAAAGQVVGAADWSTFTASAGVGLLAFAVRLATNLDTRYFRISVVALLADADGPVVDDLADSMAAASARVPAEGVDAGCLVRALVVSLAAGDDGGQGFAAGLFVGDVAIRTFADHGPDRQ